MEQPPLGRKIVILSLLMVLGIGYDGFLYFQPTVTGRYVLDGIIGVVLGLYIGSHPAAHLVEMLFYRGAMRCSFSSKRSVIGWLSLNILVLLISGMVIFFGTTRLIARTG
jgi:hypothetical protein